MRPSTRGGVAAVLLAAVVLLSACSTAPRRGAFYQDDGPPDQVPLDLTQVPDAQPRIEPFHPYANRPYQALGRWYTPMTEDRPYRARGLASWYGRQFHGARTASGEIYDMFAMTAAHPTLPIPSYARVTNLSTGTTVVVRVNDRGPFKDGRIIDLSYAAAVKLGLAGAGTGLVEVERLTFADIRALQGEAAGLADGRWSVQVGAFSEEARAQALREQVAPALALAGRPLPRVERDASIFRVLVGILPDRSAAQQLARELQQLLQIETALHFRP
ncbi:MAG: septal ring lytic transglycosylase RlpA family protein [Sutterellaceae bacterium]|nr:septal ring lytic transglycosylase RlpA family protein [Burkholderiaceae bacterium]MDW8430157.1 septal ring lytic transglycosylase RlpA family protein [Sutterellaceae bacterium]